MPLVGVRMGVLNESAEEFYPKSAIKRTGMGQPGFEAVEVVTGVDPVSEAPIVLKRYMPVPPDTILKAETSTLMGAYREKGGE